MNSTKLWDWMFFAFLVIRHLIIFNQFRLIFLLQQYSYFLLRLSGFCIITLLLPIRTW
ncbi:hypothetical protein Goklo_002065 [Gossypium klotzschianum]|uniref:Uncharacterized protein n=1 Tax=Gossypium klotzschianum TaxID=34286 RepID=A0A7J8VSZ7_9ROSI|nr:hypothetical protein [Gossypium klotzschianum]